LEENPIYNILLVGYEEGENLGLRSISAYAKQKGINTGVVPYNPNQKEAVLSAIKDTNPVIVGFSLIFQRMLPDFADLIHYLRQQGINAHFTMGGHFPTIESEKLLEIIPGLNSIVRGEGEITLVELFHKINTPGVWKDIEGLSFKNQAGQIVTNKPRKLIENLDILPFPEREKISFIHRDFKIATIISSRGCYHNCSFCSIREFYNHSDGLKRRSRSPKNIVSEMEFLYNTKDVRIFIFEDDDFYIDTNSQRQWIKQFMDELRKKNIAGNIAWRFSCRIDDINKEVFKEMMEAGLICVYLGIEAANNENLKVYDKKYTIDKIYKAIQILTELNLPFEFGFMLLNPYCTLETIKSDLKFLKKISSLGSTITHFTKMMPYSGTPIQKRLINEGRLTGTFNAPNYNYLDPKIDLLETFFHDAFHHRNFNKNGVVELLRYAKFDSLLLNKFYPTVDTQIYQKQIWQLIEKSNEQFTETMSLAISLMESKSLDEIIKYWPILNNLIIDEKNAETRITFITHQLLNNQLSNKYQEPVEQ
jgi:radical SAM superfamily enzyme YgiQ (UPF0313 family)